MEPPQICYTLVCVMVGCCSAVAGGLAEGCNINWSRMKVDPASKKRDLGSEFVEWLDHIHPLGRGELGPLGDRKGTPGGQVVPCLEGGKKLNKSKNQNEKPE